MKTSTYANVAAALVYMPLFVFAGEAQTTSATFITTEGGSAGAAELTQTPTGVLIRIEAWGLPPGIHAVHFHETGNCDPASAFESAGDHFAPGGTQHGYHSAGGPHAGDLPNQTVAADGRLQVEMLNAHVSLERGQNVLLDADGAALVIHANADDYVSQPAGDAGDRIACAILEP